MIQWFTQSCACCHLLIYLSNLQKGSLKNLHHYSTDWLSCIRLLYIQGLSFQNDLRFSRNMLTYCIVHKVLSRHNTAVCTMMVPTQVIGQNGVWPLSCYVSLYFWHTTYSSCKKNTGVCVGVSDTDALQLLSMSFNTAIIISFHFHWEKWDTENTIFLQIWEQRVDIRGAHLQEGSIITHNCLHTPPVLQKTPDPLSTVHRESRWKKKWVIAVGGCCLCA